MSMQSPNATEIAIPAAPPDPEFAVVGVRAVRYAAAPMFALDLQVTEPTGRPVYMIALTIQLMIEPARRTYDDATRAAQGLAVFWKMAAVPDRLFRHESLSS